MPRSGGSILRTVSSSARLADADGDPARQSALRALLEGDADRVQSQWRTSLDEADRREVDDDLLRQQPAAASGSSPVPGSLKTLVAAPDQLGLPLISVVLAAGGMRAVDDLFLTPPTTQEHLLDPWSLVQDHQGTLMVEAPPLETGDQVFQQGSLGAVTWMVLLASRLGPREALAAARGWGGDAYVAFEHDGTDCARIRYRADTPADRTRMRAALVRWARKGAQPAATVTRQGDGLLLESCAVERPARTPHDRSRDALDLAVAHAEVSVALVRRGLDAEVARCGADMLVDRFDSARLTAMVTHDRLPSRLVRPCLKDAGT